MKKVIVIGCPGSGKSTFAKRFSAITGLPLFHLDLLYWNPDKTTVSNAVFQKRLQEVIEQSLWILDGNFSSTMELRLKACDTVFFLDIPTEKCLEGVRARKGKPRSDLPWAETEDDADFLTYIRNYHSVSRPRVIELLNRYADRDIHVFQSREHADAYLHRLSSSFSLCHFQ